MKRKYGWKPDVPDKRDLKYKVTQPVGGTPDYVDLITPDIPDCWNQLNLGCCTGFGNGFVALYRLIKQGSLDAKKIPAFLFIYFNERWIEKTIKEDAGAQIRNGIKALNKWGLCFDDLWPYDVKKFTQKPPKSAYKFAAQHQALSFARIGTERIPTENELESALASGDPVVFGMSVYDSFESDVVTKTGIVPMPDLKKEKSLGGHCTVLVGYDRKKRLFKGRNSWGNKWGINGYFWIPYNLICGGYADDFWVIDIMEDAS